MGRCYFYDDSIRQELSSVVIRRNRNVQAPEAGALLDFIQRLTDFVHYVRSHNGQFKSGDFHAFDKPEGKDAELFKLSFKRACAAIHVTSLFFVKKSDDNEFVFYNVTVTKAGVFTTDFFYDVEDKEAFFRELFPKSQYSVVPTSVLFKRVAKASQTLNPSERKCGSVFSGIESGSPRFQAIYGFDFHCVRMSNSRCASMKHPGYVLGDDAIISVPKPRWPSEGDSDAGQID